MLTDAGRTLSTDPYDVPDDFRKSIFERDGNACRYCGFKSQKYQEIRYTGEKDPTGETNPESYATACIFCHQCFHLEQVSQMQSGAVIWLPEIGQAALNHICRAIYVARITQGPMADAARDALDALIARREEAQARLGTDEPRILASVLHDFLETKEYRLRDKRLQGFRILPLDRRIIREGDLEFNQFPQILAYWRSKDGPYGETPPRQWDALFFEVREKTGGG